MSDQNYDHLNLEIKRARRRDVGIGLSVNRYVISGLVIWDVCLGRHRDMCLLDAKTDYSYTSDLVLFSAIVNLWDEDNDKHE